MSRRATPHAAVWLPEVLARYGCGQTLLCCRRPWRAYLYPGEAEDLEGRLGRAGARAVGDRLRAALRPARGEPGREALVLQPGGRCALLDPDRRCALQAAAGLGALPASCRTFPRSVVALPGGLDVAFLLACPTAAAMVVAAPRPVRLVSVDPAAWPYPPAATVGPEVRWDGARVLPLEAMLDLRRRWWAAIERAAARGGEGALALLEALLVDPAAPEGADRAAGRAAAPVAFTPEEAVEIGRYLALLPGTGAGHRARRARLTEALARGRDREALRRSAEAAPAVWLTALGLALQFAGVHTTVPAAEGMAHAATEVAVAVAVHAALAEVEGGSGPTSQRDALVVAARVAVGFT